MTAPPPLDLRQRIVAAVEEGSSIRQAARRSSVSVSAAIKLMRRVRKTGSLKPAQIGGYRCPVMEPYEALLRELAEGEEITLAEIQAELSRRVGLTPDLSTIYHHLRRLGLQRKQGR
ncbi:helix-turn-helix domain-containing protein [Microvirga arsenatis]|uniref:helix-turn-helix domain-containing protein n=1 Tax=Microvirga arsenatis TaxID=2692265 RepID=UPI003CCE2291